MDLDIHEMDLQLASANDEIRELKALLDHKRSILAKARALANHQKLNEGLWKPPISAMGQDLQQALRDLHGALDELQK